MFAKELVDIRKCPNFKTVVVVACLDDPEFYSHGFSLSWREENYASSISSFVCDCSHRSLSA